MIEELQAIRDLMVSGDGNRPVERLDKLIAELREGVAGSARMLALMQREAESCISTEEFKRWMLAIETLVLAFSLVNVDLMKLAVSEEEPHEKKDNQGRLRKAAERDHPPRTLP